MAVNGRSIEEAVPSLNFSSNVTAFSARPVAPFCAVLSVLIVKFCVPIEELPIVMIDPTSKEAVAEFIVLFASAAPPNEPAPTIWKKPFALPVSIVNPESVILPGVVGGSLSRLQYVASSFFKNIELYHLDI